ncbi:MAG: hypothetical protein ACT4OF_16905 [Caulobacteraceae bacterium]
MLLRKLVVVGLVGFVSFAANIATAQDAVAPSVYAVDGVNLVDPSQVFSNRFQLSLSDGQAPRFAGLAPVSPSGADDTATRRYELQFVASGVSGLDVSFAQRGGIGFNDQGDIERQSRASELRLGRGLRGMERDDERSAEPSWYLFAASEDEALVWRPGVRNAFGGGGSSFAVQDQVEVGDMQIGITYERYGVQASLAYVEREFSVRSGSQSFRQDENFAGFTLTMRH